jgi:(1->4)-alpha-D-glucan 1-alpha-D-glucosylmutase
LGIFGSLGQTLAKITAPGVPDFYQGTELWDLSLVDPDNRRPVDFSRRKKALNTITTRAEKDLPALIGDLLADPGNGLIKMFLIHRALRFRGVALDLFDHGEYLPLTVEGRHGNRVIAYERRLDGRRAIVVLPRFLSGLIDEGEFPLGEKIWQDTRVDFGAGGGCVWRNVVTGQTLAGQPEWPLGMLLANFPVALLANFDDLAKSHSRRGPDRESSF